MNQAQKDKHEQAILKLVQEKKLMRFDHIFGHYTGCCRSTAYDNGLDKSDIIKEALAKNRQKATDYLLQKWISGDNPTLQISAMRLVCSSDEHRLLNQSYMEQSGTTTQIVVSKQEDKEALEKEY